MIKIQIYKGREISTFIQEIAELRITVFREFPYLYDGSLEYEKDYLAKFTENPNAIIAIAFDKEKVIGAFTGLPIRDEDQAIVNVLPEEHKTSSFYFSEIVLLKEYRKQGIGFNLFQTFEKYIIELQLYKRIYFASILRPITHPLRPTDFKSADLIWAQNGYIKTELTCLMSWKEINEAEETEKELAIWEKKLD